MDVRISVMLLGSVAFLMVLFYMVNYRDDNIRRYAWSIISSAIGTFGGSILFSALCEIPRLATIGVLHDNALPFDLVLNYGFFLCLFVLLQATVGFISGTICERHAPASLDEGVWVVADNTRADYGRRVGVEELRGHIGRKNVAYIDGRQVFVRRLREQMDKRVSKLQCFGSLFAFMTGFAAIHAGGTLQHLPYFAESPGMAVVSVFINQVFLFLTFRGAQCWRRCLTGSSSGRDERDTLFDEQIYDSQNDIGNLALSFLAIQALRFQVTGLLPNTDGLEEPEELMRSKCVIMLYACGFVFALLAVVLVFVSGVLQYSWLRRVVGVYQGTAAMCFAWCVLCATRWQAMRIDALVVVAAEPGTMAGQLLLALVLSLGAFLLMFPLRKVEDLAGKEPLAQQAGIIGVVQNIITALGVLVGVSWTSCFVVAVDAVTSSSPRPLILKDLLTMGVLILLIPAWQKYILPKVLAYRQLLADHLEVRGGADVADHSWSRQLRAVMGSDHDYSKLSIAELEKVDQPHVWRFHRDVDSRLSGQARLGDGASRGPDGRMQATPLRVKIVSARGIRRADWLPGRKSDPYVECTVLDRPGSKVIRTPVLQKTLEPVWNYEDDLPDYVSGDALVFSVMDQDFIKSDDILGRATLMGSDLVPNGFTGDLLLIDAGKGARAYLKVQVTPIARDGASSNSANNWYREPSASALHPLQ